VLTERGRFYSVPRIRGDMPPPPPMDIDKNHKAGRGVIIHGSKGKTFVCQ